MSDQSFLNFLNLPDGADLNLVERLFASRLDKDTKDGLETYDDAQASQSLTLMKEYYYKLHDYVSEWAHEEKLKNADKDLNEFSSTKKSAEDALKLVHSHMIESATCLFHIKRFNYQLETEVNEMGDVTKQSLEEASKIGGDLGALFTKNTQKKLMLQQKLDELTPAYEITKKVEALLAEIDKEINDICGKDEAVARMRSIVSSYRTENFTRIRTVLREITEKKGKSLLGGSKKDAITRLDTNLTQLTELLSKNSKILLSSDQRLYLGPAEVETAYDDLLKQLGTIKAFMVKNYVIYLRHRFILMKGLEKSLNDTSSPKELLSTYRKLATAIAEPLTTLKESRFFENDVIEPAQRHIKTQGKTIHDILERAQTYMSELRTNQIEFANLSVMLLKPLKEQQK